MDIVFQHGGGQGGWVWNDTIAEMERQAPGAHRYLALDMPGCGKKLDRDTTAISFDDIVREQLGDIAAAGFAKVMMVGHSQAGTVIPPMVERRADLFRHLVLVSCVAPAPGEKVRSCAAAFHENDAVNLITADIPMLERHRLMHCPDMTRAQQEKFLAAVGTDWWPASSYAQDQWSRDHLGDVSSTYVICLQDKSLPAQAQAIFADRFRSGRRVQIDCGHQAMNARPSGLAEILLIEADRLLTGMPA